MIVFYGLGYSCVCMYFPKGVWHRFLYSMVVPAMMVWGLRVIYPTLESKVIDPYNSLVYKFNNHSPRFLVNGSVIFVVQSCSVLTLICISIFGTYSHATVILMYTHVIFSLVNYIYQYISDLETII